MMQNHGTEGSWKNKLVILDIETPGRKGVKSHEYLDIPNFCTASRTGCIGVQNVKLVLSEPLWRRPWQRLSIVGVLGELTDEYALDFPYPPFRINTRCP